MTLYQQRASWVGVVVIGVLLPFAPAVFGLRTLSHADTDHLYGPVRTLIVEALRDWRLPLWNPYEGTGKPLFAEGIHSVLHPLSLLGAAVAPSSIDFLILAYLVAASLGAFLLASTLGASSPASAGAGLAYALSGYSVSMTGNLVFLAGLSTLPWLLAAARSAGKGSRWGIVLTALATASAFFSGDVQITLVGLVLGTLLAADVGGLRGAARALTGFTPGILLAGVQILATYELLPLTYRSLIPSADLTDPAKSQWSLAPGRLLEWFVPGLFQGSPREFPITASGRPIDPEFSQSVYLGAPLLFAAALGARRRGSGGGHGTVLVLSGAAFFFLWLALGHHAGARQALDWIPVWNRFRFSEKVMAPLTVCISALGAIGIDAFVKRPLGRSAKRALVASTIVILGLLVFLHFAPVATADLAVRMIGDAGTFYRSTLAAGLPHLLLALVAFTTIDRIQGPIRVFILPLLVTLAPAAAVYYGAHLGAHEARHPRAPLPIESTSPTPRIAHPAEYLPAAPVEDRVEAGALISSLLLFPVFNVAQRVDTVEPFGAFAPRRLTELATSFEAGWALHFRRYGLTHVLVPIPADPGGRVVTDLATRTGRIVYRDEARGAEVWAVPHRPWAFFPMGAVAASGRIAALDRLMEAVRTGDDATVVVEVPVPPPTAPGRVLAFERETGQLRVEAESVSPALLVVQDAFWPGWRASIDGQPTEILAADYLVRAVRWPAGRHSLEMVYDPPEIGTGLAISGFGALLVLILAGLASRRPSTTPVAP